MPALLLTLGIVVLGLGLADVFLTALNYDESGFLATRLCRLQWCCIRIIARRLPRRWRLAVLRQVIGLCVVSSVIIWLATVTIGYGLIYYSQMQGANFQYAGRGLTE